MSLSKRYDAKEAEPRLMDFWQAAGVYHFEPEASGPVYSIDTPPPTVSGHLHLGHVYSYSHPDFIARFWRMNGHRVFYPMGYDDNGLPTERLVERQLGITAQQVGRQAFIEKCLEVSEAAEKDYEALWQRLGLSIDWRFTYRTIDDLSRRTSQLSFIDLVRKGLVYQQEAPAIWCPECRTSIAQAELHDLDRASEFVTLAFGLPEEASDAHLPVATTRPELLPACVAVFVHPEDKRYLDLVGKVAKVPLFESQVPILADPSADPGKGTGAVMCCTFGDTTDVAWWRSHHLPLIDAVTREGRLTGAAGPFAGLELDEARRQMKQALEEESLLLDRQPVNQSVRVHERCDTPVEYIIVRQWFVRLLDFKAELLEAGNQVNWYPDSMQARYRAWVENLNWDWCLSRQRYFGVPFPVWYCRDCAEPVLADESQLPVDPLVDRPLEACACGCPEFVPEEDVFDTWATSSMSPQIVGRWMADPELYQQVFPFSLRPQAHEIIRTWAFYTLAKSLYHFGKQPWADALISGWGIAGEGAGKISKSRGGGPMPPFEMIERYSADAVRYWAASTSPGKDSVISEEKIQLGARLVNKLWNVARFADPFISGLAQRQNLTGLSPADRWILSRLQRLVRKVTELMKAYEYAAAKSEIESFFWTELADNYLEMAKQRLYEGSEEAQDAARFTLHQLLLTTLKLLAPFLPYVTEEIYRGLFAGLDQPGNEQASIHRAAWPQGHAEWIDEQAERTGETLVQIATAVRRYKSEHNLPLSYELGQIQVAAIHTAQGASPDEIIGELQAASEDLKSITRSRQVEFTGQIDPSLESIPLAGSWALAIETPAPGD